MRQPVERSDSQGGVRVAAVAGGGAAARPRGAASPRPGGTSVRTPPAHRTQQYYKCNHCTALTSVFRQ